MRTVESSGRAECSKKRFAGRLQESRAKAGISQVALAVKAGVTPVTISRYERGDCTPRRGVAYRISAALNVAADWLLDGVPNEQPDREVKAVDISVVPTAALLTELSRRHA